MSHLPLNSPLGNLYLKETYHFYDMPVLFSCCSNDTGELFIAVWVDKLATEDLWLYAPISEERLSLLRKGTIDVRSVFTSTEGSYVWEVYTPFTNSPARATKMACNSIAEHYLPEAGIKL